jgi:two-component system, chemotaxis family, chemotaxis protein CheY
MRTLNGPIDRKKMRPRMKPRKVLIVEDSKLVHMLYEVMFQDWPIVHANDGIEALQQLTNNQDVEVILLDMNMPRMNGLDFLKNVKSHPRFANIPVVVVSTEGGDEITKRAVSGGAAAYIKKPFGSQAILDLLSRVTSAGQP